MQNVLKSGSYSQEKSLFFKLQSIERNQCTISTIGTILERILQKEYAVSKRKGLHHIFIPLVSREDYLQIIEEQDLSKVSGKIEDLIASFYGKDTLTSRQAEKLREVLKEMKNDQFSYYHPVPITDSSAIIWSHKMPEQVWFSD